MKADELMVGNWVDYNNSPYKTTIASINYAHLYEPMELTEENIFDLLGFKPVEGITGLYSNKNGIEVDFDCNTVKVPNHVKRIRRPKHVHKLQQLLKSLEE